VQVHLPCPALREWLPVLLDGKRVLASNPRAAPTRVRPVLRAWPQIDPDASPAAFEAEAFVYGVSLERPHPPEAILAALPSGVLVIELAVPRGRMLRRLLGLGDRPQRRANAGQSRTLQWLGRGYFEVEQWETVDPAGVIVTIARVRR
jgi:hypothetical protein